MNLYQKNFLRFSVISLLIFLTSCTTLFFEKSSAKLTFFNSINKKTFSFVVSEEFVKENSRSKPSQLYPKMTNAELKLLTKLMRNNNYCINQNGELSFKINSKQEKVYDVTFSNVIEQSYNARPVSPTTYFGECL